MKIVLTRRTQIFFGLYFFGLGIAIAGNDNPIWWTSHPMSNGMQSFLVLFNLTLGAWILGKNL